MAVAIHQHESATGVPPHPEHPSNPFPTPSLWVAPEHWLWVPCFMHQTCTVIYSTYGNVHVSMLFSQSIPPSPSPTETKSLFFTSVSPFAALHVGSWLLPF